MRFYGQIGYADCVEQPAGSGIWIDEITERPYFGDVIQNRSSWSHGYEINDNVSIANRISVVADPYAYNNFSKIKYVRWMNQAWKVSSVEVERPRLILTIGEVWNGEQAEPSCCS